MEPVTHGLASLAMSRAGLGRVSPRATWILLASGYAPDVDWGALFFGVPALYSYRRVLGHSLTGCAALALLVATVFWLVWRRDAKRPVRFARALGLSAAGGASHLLLDLPNRYGMKLFWPFGDSWQAWGIAESVDPLPLVILLIGLLLPALFRLVSEEIGARRDERSAQRWAAGALAVMTLFFTARMVAKQRAEAILDARVYRGAPARTVAAYPTAISPLRWHGVVETENTVEELDVNVAAGASAFPETQLTHYKPEPSPMLEAAIKTSTVQGFLKFARIPLARVQRLRDGWRVEVRDARFAGDPTRWGGFIAAVEMNMELRVTKEEILSVQAMGPD
jgi:inner membrane protein